MSLLPSLGGGRHAPVSRRPVGGLPAAPAAQLNPTNPHCITRVIPVPILLVRCPGCGAPVEGGCHVDSGLTSCGWSA